MELIVSCAIVKLACAQNANSELTSTIYFSASFVYLTALPVRQTMIAYNAQLAWASMMGNAVSVQWGVLNVHFPQFTHQIVLSV